MMKEGIPKRKGLHDENHERQELNQCRRINVDTRLVEEIDGCTANKEDKY